MREVGIDLSAATPQLLTAELAGRVNLLITMGCGEECPYVPGVERDDWALPDPKGRPVEEVRAIRDDIAGGSRRSFTRAAGRAERAHREGVTTCPNTSPHACRFSTGISRSGSSSR